MLVCWCRDNYRTVDEEGSNQGRRSSLLSSRCEIGSGGACTVMLIKGTVLCANGAHKGFKVRLSLAAEFFLSIFEEINKPQWSSPHMLELDNYTSIIHHQYTKT